MICKIHVFKIKCANLLQILLELTTLTKLSHVREKCYQAVTKFCL